MEVEYASPYKNNIGDTKRQMNKKGIITIWSITLVVLLSHVMTTMDNRNRHVDWLSSINEKELIYHHLITMEQWAKKQLKLGYRLPKIMKVNKPNLKVEAILRPSDGKININSMKWSFENQWKYSIFLKMFKDFGFSNPKEKLQKVLMLLEVGNSAEAMNELGDLSRVFINRKLISPNVTGNSENSNYVQSPYFLQENMVNINALSPELASVLLSVSIEDAKDFINVHNNKSKEDLQDNPYPQYMQSLWKVSSLFYELEGHIIVNNRRSDFVIHLNKEGSLVKTTKRKMH